MRISGAGAGAVESPPQAAAAVGVFAWYDADGRADLGQLIDRAVAAVGELAY